MTENLVNCYNRGCGKKFDPAKNNDDDCQHHPGQPVFHDAYKGWSCCNKKCIDFTEFLNIKGCTNSPHSNKKPPEPEKPAVDKSKAHEVIEVVSRSLNSIPSLKRPAFDAPQAILKPTVSQTLIEQIKGLKFLENSNGDQNIVAIGQSCKNNSCKATYQGPASDEEVCTYHPGSPIFHEGMKYWSCCQKKTTDFTVFLAQVGCTQGNHKWIDKESNKKEAKCRVDWHQTPSHVIVSIFAKKYDPDLSEVKLNPIHLTVELFFPEEKSNFNFDVELRGIVDVEASTVSMVPTKTEIKLKKKEAGSWSRLEIPKTKETKKVEESNSEETISSQVDAVDLSDL